MDASEHCQEQANVKAKGRHLWYWLVAIASLGAPSVAWVTWSLAWSEVCTAVDPRGHRATVTCYSPYFTWRHHYYLQVDAGVEFAMVEGSSTIKVGSSGEMPDQEVVRGWVDRGYIGYLETLDEDGRAPKRMEWLSTAIVVYSRDGVVGRFETRAKE